MHTNTTNKPTTLKTVPLSLVAATLAVALWSLSGCSKAPTQAPEASAQQGNAHNHADGHTQPQPNQSAPKVEFEAGGENPAWRASIAGDSIIYKTKDSAAAQTLPVTRSTEGNEQHFKGSLDGKSYTLNLSGTECFDDAAGESFEFTATFEIDGSTLSGCAERI